jgi:drug/metabolite transporter (DMT)-like permease
VLFALGVTSILATALAFLLQTWGQKYTTATRAALIFSLEPVFAWLTSYVFEHEVLTGQAFAGAGCILGGILLVELKPLERGGATRY